MAKDQDILTDWNEAYDIAYAGASNYLAEADRDFRIYMGDQWDLKYKSWLTSNKRAALVFNEVARAVRLLSGYQRRVRLAMKVGPVGLEDDPVAQQLSAAVMFTMTNANGYNVMSDAFRSGALITGRNWVEPYFDEMSGLVRLRRLAHNKCLPDPTAAELNMNDDCDYFLRRELLTRNKIKMLTKGLYDDLIDNVPADRDMKFPDMPWVNRQYVEKLVTYDEFWEKKARRRKMLIHLPTGEEIEWTFGAEKLRFLLHNNPEFDAIDRWTNDMQLNLIIGGKEVPYHDTDPLGIGLYPFIQIVGFWHPEMPDDRYNLQGVVRALRDPQTEYNKRLCQEIDLVESQLNSGYKAKEGAVVDEDSLYMAGQGKAIFIRKQFNLADVEKLQPAQIPPSWFQLNQELRGGVTRAAGISEESFGTETKDIPGIVAKLRQGAGLTITQDLFDNYRLSKRELGKLLVRIIQRHYSPATVQRIINEPLHPGFQDADTLKYDCNLQEGVLSDTQRQMYYAELTALYDRTGGPQGSPIPVDALIEAAPLSMKKELMERIKQNQQAQQQAQAKRTEQEDLLKRLQEAQIIKDIRSAEERQSQAEENRTGAAYDRAKTAAEVQKMGVDNVVNILKAVKDLRIETPAGGNGGRGRRR